MATPPVLRNESSNLSDSNVPKDPTLNETPTLFKNSQIYPSNCKTSKVFTKSQQNLKKILKYYSTPCSIEKQVFQSTRFKCTKRTRTKRIIPTLLKNSQICPSNRKTSKVCRKSQQNLQKLLKH